MKKTLLTTSILVAALLVPSLSFAALTQYTGSTTNKDATRAQLNSAITEIDSEKADVSCFASESAFNACFDLTWATGGSVSNLAYNAATWDGVDTVSPSQNAVRD